MKLSDNELIMLQVIRRNPMCSKSDLANTVQMPWSTAYSVIKKLGNMIRYDDSISSNYRAGVTINPFFEYYIGVSVGSSQIKVVILGFDFNIIKYVENKTWIDFHDALSRKGFRRIESCDCAWCLNTPSSFVEVQDVLVALCKAICSLKESYVPITTVNFTFPGHIDFYNQKIISTSNLCSDSSDLKNCNITRFITSTVYERLLSNNINVYIDHNVKSSAIAEKEYRYTKYQTNDDMMVLYLGKGIGMSAIIDGKLYRDRDNSSGQFGEMRIFFENRNQKVGDIIRDTLLDNPAINESTTITSYLDKHSDIKKNVIQALSLSIANIVHVLGIKDIVFSGKFYQIIESIEHEMMQNLEDLGVYGIRMYSSHYKESSAAVGAAMGGFYNKYEIEYRW